MTKEIQLTQGKIALVDDADYEWLNQWKWYAFKNRSGAWYARRFKKTDLRPRVNVFMHRLILNAREGMEVDHANHDTLDNRRENLRECTKSQNMHNAGKNKRNTTGYKGVWWKSTDNQYAAAIKINGKRIYLGRFTDPVKAALAYDEAAKKYHGEFAYLNFPK
jgi:hypothetical protein